MGLKHPTIAPYGAFRCADGREVILSIQNEREWARLCAEVIGDAAMAADARFCSNEARVANRPALDAALGAVLGRLTRAEAMAKLEAAGIACGALNDLDDLIAHPQRRLASVATPHGEIELMAPGARIAGASVATLGRVPALGEHSEALRREFGAQTHRDQP
jgi:crotonobetainyl-CoA:carnitine CoA-transferase CaiB-like acyl-CoA transferase